MAVYCNLHSLGVQYNIHVTKLEGIGDVEYKIVHFDFPFESILVMIVKSFFQIGPDDEYDLGKASIDSIVDRIVHNNLPVRANSI